MKTINIIIIVLLFVVLPISVYFGYKKYVCSSKKKLYPDALKDVPCDKIDTVGTRAKEKYKSWARRNKDIEYLRKNRKGFSLEKEAQEKWEKGQLGAQIENVKKEMNI